MGIFEEFKAFSEMVLKLGSADINAKLIEIQSKIIGIQQENIELSKELNDLKALNEIRENLIFDNNMYWIRKSDKNDGPYCTKCFDENGKLIRLHSQGSDYKCPSCNTYIDTDLKDNLNNNSEPIVFW